jgi:hypothetical protein
VTAIERSDATSLRVRRYRMMGLPRCPYVSTLAGTKVWPGCRWPACDRHLSLSLKAAAALLILEAAAKLRSEDESWRHPAVWDHEVGKGQFNVSKRPLTAHSGNANRSVTGLRSRIAARAGGDAAESSFQWSCRRERLPLRRLQLMAWSMYLPQAADGRVMALRWGAT